MQVFMLNESLALLKSAKHLLCEEGYNIIFVKDFMQLQAWNRIHDQVSTKLVMEVDVLGLIRHVRANYNTVTPVFILLSSTVQGFSTEEQAYLSKLKVA